jgi:hypothetical protein
VQDLGHLGQHCQPLCLEIDLQVRGQSQAVEAARSQQDHRQGHRAALARVEGERFLPHIYVSVSRRYFAREH